MKAFIEQRADPFIFRKDGRYYFTASVPAFDRVILRSADTLEGLRDAVEKTVWIRHPSGIMSCNIWAWDDTSRALVISSHRRILGCTAIALAIAKR